MRKESRTLVLAQELMACLGGKWQQLDLYSLKLEPLNADSLKERQSLIEEGAFFDERFALARQFAEAESIVIAAPYWDLSFPAQLKTYIENIYIVGLVTRFDDQGNAHGQCRANKLYYVTTAGGSYEPAYGYGLIDRLATGFFGIKSTELIYAENLDIAGYCSQDIINNKVLGIRQRYGNADK